MASDVAIIGALIVIVLGVLLARRVEIPYTLVLVVAGLLIGAFHLLPTYKITPHLIFLVLLPPLLFDGSVHLNYSLIRRNISTIVLLAVPGVVCSALLVAWLLHLALGRAFGPLLVFGALIAATDPISVLTIFRQVRAPAELAVLIEGESLFNDGTAIVLFNIAVAGVLGGSFTLSNTVGQFFVVSAGGVALGLVIGIAAVTLIRQINDHLVETTVTTIVAWGGFLTADLLGLSGPLTVVVAGMMLGHLRESTLSPRSRLALETFWEYVDFLGNALVFLLIGTVVASGGLNGLPEIGVAVLVVLVARGVVVGLTNVVLLRRRRAMPWRWATVLWWGGLRGAVALALALSLPLGLPERQWIQVTAFGVVVASLLGEGLTMELLLGWLGLHKPRPVQADYDRHAALLFSYRRALVGIDEAQRTGDLTDLAAEKLHAEYSAVVEREERILEQLAVEHPFLRAAELRRVRRRLLLTRRAALLDFQLGSGVAGGSVERLVDDIDSELVRLDDAQLPELESAERPGRRPPGLRERRLPRRERSEG